MLGLDTRVHIDSICTLFKEVMVVRNEASNAYLCTKYLQEGIKVVVLLGAA